MGSQSKIDLAYIAGFLDGDGSVMIQIKKRKDGRLKRRFMLTICFYQDSRHEQTLFWIRDVLGIGYVARRNDGMTELRINGFEQIQKILMKLKPFIRFKSVQVRAMLKAAKILIREKQSHLKKSELVKLVDHIVVVQNHNYVTKKKKTREELLKILEVTP